MEENLQQKLEDLTINADGGRDYQKLANEYGDFELPKEIKMAFRAGQGNFFGGCINRAKIRMFHIQKSINPQDVSYLIGLPNQRLEGEDFKTYKNRQKLSRILYRDRNYLSTLSEARSINLNKQENAI